MEIEGKVWKEGKFWIVEVPALNFMTQGSTKKEVLEMTQDGVMGLVECYFESKIDKSFSINVDTYEDGIIVISSSDKKLLPALSLRRQREKSGSTVREVSERLGSKSPNAYAQYEKGKTSITLDKFELLLGAVNPLEVRRLRIV